MSAIPTLTVVYADGREVRINETDFDPAIHRLPHAAPPREVDEDGDGDATTDERPTSKRKPRR